MKRAGPSLQSRFQIAILSGLALVLLMMALLWFRQQRSQQEAIEIARQNMHTKKVEKK